MQTNVGNEATQLKQFGPCQLEFLPDVASKCFKKSNVINIVLLTPAENRLNKFPIKRRRRTSGQDGRVGGHGARLLSRPHRNYN